ncbi:MAG: hypothetical protein KTR31_11070 [Myxococcales bacterium]|nr:hypothetical protein [Myxococcales bacterium]
MRVFLVMVGVSGVLLSLLGCSDPFVTAQSEDTVEAYEAYLADNPDGRWVQEANDRLEVLLLEKAKADKTLASYDAYLERFPEGALRDNALEQREEFLFRDAKTKNTLEAWKGFLEEYPKAKKRHRNFATRMVQVHGYLPNLTIGEIRQKKVNMAEDPEGPLNGWGFWVDVTNNGTETLTDLRLAIQHLSPEGGVLDEKEWALVAANWPTPVEEERKEPMKPGETRTWEWSQADLPERWDEKSRVYVSRIAMQ